MQLNLSTIATLGTEESGCCREVLNKSQCMNLLSPGTKKFAVVERWPLVEVRRYSPSLWNASQASLVLILYDLRDSYSPTVHDHKLW